ncbi:hypothetical protein MD484_g1910, partial [Candolleomyces efflorescens]
MAPPQPKPPRPQLKRQKSGLLTGVFNFVSQEVQNFVANATGTVNDQELVGDEEGEEEEFGDEEYGSEEYEEYEEVLNGASPRVSEPSSSRRTPKAVRRSPSPRKAPKSLSERTPSPRPILTRRPSKPQMPGSLFPLSPSPDDDSDDDSRAKRHVHFEGGDSPENAVDLTDGGGPSNTRSPSKHRGPATPIQKPRFTSPSISGSPSSVRSAVERFHDAEADPAMLLPIHPSSPTRPRRSDNPLPERSLAMSGRAKGKAPAKPYDRTFGTSKSSSSVHHRDDTISEMAPPPPPLDPKPILNSARGGDAELKIQELEQEVQRLREELARRPPRQSTPLLNNGFAPPPPPPPPPPPTGTIFRVPSESSNLDQVFTSVRAALKHNTPPKEKPINKMNGKACIGVPPDKMAAFLTELKTVRLKKVVSSDRSFASEGDVSVGALSFNHHDRTFDRSFGVANEKRKRALNDDHTSGELERALKRRSMSMSNLKASNNGDRSFGSSSSTTRNASANSSFESTSTSASNTSSTSQPSTSSQQLLLPAALSRSHNHIREWRTGSASTSSSQTDALTPSLCSDQDGGESHCDDPGPTTPPSNILHFRPPTPPLRKDDSVRDILPEEPQYEISLRAPPSPVSPPLPAIPPPSAGYRPLGPPPPPPARRTPDVGNVGGDSSMTMTTRQRTTSTTKFDKRQPVSPLPDKSPRRPRPPARPLNISNNSKNLPRRVLVMSEDEHEHEHEDGDEEEDPLSLSFDRTASRSLPLSFSQSQIQTQPQPRPRYSLPRRVVVPPPVPDEAEAEAEYEATPTPAPKPSLFPPPPPQRVAAGAAAGDASSRRASTSASRSIIRRRQTLDEELRLAAADHSLLQDETLGDWEYFDEEDTVYMGLGTMEQRGFLAHGGGGGPAVYMDPGF